MRLQLSPEMESFREEMRTFFTTQVSQEIRDTVAAHRHPTPEHLALPHLCTSCPRIGHRRDKS